MQKSNEPGGKAAFSLENSKMYSVLIARYGPLMNMDELANVLRRTRKNIQSVLAKPDPPAWALALRAARVYHGRRVLFRTPDVAELIETGMGKPEADVA